MKIIETKAYLFEELSEEAKSKAIAWQVENNYNYDTWSEYLEDDCKEIGALMGIEINNIYCSGFHSQGDGACFEGSYSYKKGSVASVLSYAPLDLELHRIVRELQKVQKKNFYRIKASVKHYGHYYHRFCTDINVDINGIETGSGFYTRGSIEDSAAADCLVICLLRDFMLWIYKQYELVYEDATSEETAIGFFSDNECYFTNEGAPV